VADIAPTKAMQFGHAFQQLMQQIAYADPAFGPVHMTKLDIADGYYHVPLSTSGIPQLGVIMPFHTNDGDPIIAFPITLPMGWKDSPPFFCVTKTIMDICNVQLQEGVQHASPHPLELLADDIIFSLAPPALTGAQPRHPTQVPAATLTTPFAYVDVYVDDIIGLAQTEQAKTIM